MGIIPKEQLVNVQRWQITAFDKPAEPPSPPAARAPAAPPPPETPAVELPSAESIARIEEEARNDGHQAGYQAGYEEGIRAADEAIRQATEPLVQRLLTLTGNFQQALAEIDQSVADHLLELAAEIAARMVCGALSVNTEILLPVVREAIATLPMHHGHVTLRLSPEDATAIRAHHGEQFAQSGIQIVEDSEVSPGGCIVRAGTSEVDASIETRWKRVLDALGVAPRQWLTP